MIDLIDYRLNKEKDNLHNKEDFEAVPHEGIRCLEKSIHSFEDYYKFVKKYIIWHNEKLFLFDPNIKNLFEPILSKKEKGSVENYLIKSIKGLIKENQLIDAIICGKVLPLSIETADLFLEISQEGISANLYNEVQNLLFRKTFPGDIVWSSPAIFLEIKNIFKQMLNKIEPGRLNNLIRECIEIIEKQIKDDIKRNEEYNIQS